MRQKVHDGSMAGSQIAQLFLGKPKNVNDFVLFPLVVAVECLFEMMTNADVIDHEALVLAGSSYTIDACDRLQEPMCHDDLIEIHDLLDGSIEAGQQHIVYDDDANVALNAFLLFVEGQLETLDRRFVLRL